MTGDSLPVAGLSVKVEVAIPNSRDWQVFSHEETVSGWTNVDSYSYVSNRLIYLAHAAVNTGNLQMDIDTIQARFTKP